MQRNLSTDAHALPAQAVQERWGHYRADHAQLKPLQAKLECARAEHAKAAKRKLQDLEQRVTAAVACRER